MSKGTDTARFLREELGKRYTVHQKDVGADAKLSKSGMAFETEAFEIEGLGHLCVLRMKAMLGLMNMETVVLAPFTRDLPLLNLDWVGVMGKETQIVELYDTQLQPCPQEALEAFERIRARDGDLQDYSAGKEHWYDSILYPCSYHKTGKGISARLSAAATDYIRTYVGLLDTAPACDREAKKALVRAFAERLLAEGGPAVDQVTKLFGRELAGRLILGHMYGVR